MTEDQPAIETIEMHTGGEPVRIVTAGYPVIPGATILDKRRYAREHLDHLRRLIIFEPRGHYDMYAVVPVAPDLPGADMAVLFLHNEGYSTMCGHAVIALGRYAVDHGLVAPREPLTPVNIQCPCGMVQAEVEVGRRDGALHSGAVAFTSVPSFAFALDRVVDIDGHGPVTLDIGYGGAFYAVLPASRLGLDLQGSPLTALVAAADRVTRATAQAVALSHPEDADLAFLYGTILTDDNPGSESRPSRNVCVFAQSEVDRSPTGSGVSARVALAAARGDMKAGETRWYESITGALFTGAVASDAGSPGMPAVRVRVAGRAFYTGRASFTLEEGDDLGRGFLLR